jgi:peptide-methionine (S)-S-oxide reductase
VGDARGAAPRRNRISAKKANPMVQTQHEIVTLGGGCFWCLEAVFDELQGVVSVESGYMGGDLKDPTYADVCRGTSGHAEVVQISFDPAAVGLREILQVFFVIHDPTTLNYQGNDYGPQYRSVIFYHSPEQKAVAEEVIAKLESDRLWGKPIVTELAAAAKFYIAESDHQEYFERNPDQPYCMMVVQPKVTKFRKLFIDRLKKK